MLQKALVHAGVAREATLQQALSNIDDGMSSDTVRPLLWWLTCLVGIGVLYVNSTKKPH